MTEPTAGNEPTGRKPPDSPPVAAGSVMKSPKGYLMTHLGEVVSVVGDFFSVTGGLTYSYTHLVSSKNTLGWEHKTIVGGSRAVHAPFENKGNIGIVANYIGNVKSEKTMGKKDEFIIGMKLQRVDGKKYRMESGQKVVSSDVEKAQKNKAIDEHVAAIQKILSKLFEEDIKNFEEEHNRVEAVINKLDEEYGQVDAEIDKWTQKCTAFYRGGITQYREECDNVASKYAGTFKSLASAAHEINASATLELTVKANAKFVAGSMVKLAAALTKAG
jgi:hypothetical protein